MGHVSETAYVDEITINDTDRSLYALVKNQKGTEIIECSVKGDVVAFDYFANIFIEVEVA